MMTSLENSVLDGIGRVKHVSYNIYMRILVIISSFEMYKELRENIIILNNYMKKLFYTVHYAGISSSDDFKNYEDIIEFKFKMINPKKQLTKICHFIKENREQLNYDWYVKIRPEIMPL
jgi:hypothetical protein